MQLKLELKRAACVRGESVPFVMRLTNDGAAPVEDVLTFDPDNERTTLIATPEGAEMPPPPPPNTIATESAAPKGQITGDAFSIDAREGTPEHGTSEETAETLMPGGSMSTDGDILQWLGELKQGKWDLQASHRPGNGETLLSDVVRLEVLPAEATRVASQTSSLRSGSAPVLSAWRHEPGGIVFHQVLSPTMPRAAYRCTRIAEAAEDATLYPASVVDMGISPMHVLATTGDGLLMTVINEADGSPIGRGVVQGTGPFTIPVGTPLSRSDGRVFVVAGDAKRTKLALLVITPDGQASQHPIDSKGACGCEPNAEWEYESAVRVLWADSRARGVSIAEAPLTDPDAGFKSRSMYAAPGPVVALQLHSRPGVNLTEHPPGTPAEQIQAPRPQTNFWCVYEDRLNEGKSDEKLMWRSVYGPVALPQPAVRGTIELTGTDAPRVLCQRLSTDGELMLLITDASGTLRLANMAKGTLIDVTPLAHATVTAANRPELVVSTASGARPWVYLRWIDRKAGRLAWTKLAPEEFNEPDQHGHSH